MFVKHLEETARIFLTELSFIKGYNSVKLSMERDSDVPNMEEGSLVLRKKEFDKKTLVFHFEIEVIAFCESMWKSHWFARTYFCSKAE